jgi:hypothetical protein
MYFYSVQFFLIVIYVVLFLWVLKRLQFAERVGIPFIVLLVLYSFNVLGSELNLWYHLQDYAHSDAAFYFEEARRELGFFEGNPLRLLNDFFFNWGNWHGRLNFLNPANTPYWSNLGSLFNGKFMLLATALSLGHIMVTPVFYTAAFFIGQLMLYKTFCALKPSRKGVLLVAVFLLPSVLFWCQGVHKDGWMMMAFGVLVYGMHGWCKTRAWRYWMMILLAILFSLLVRYFYILLLLPALLMWWVAQGSASPLKVFGLGYVLIFLLLMVCSLWVPVLNPMPLLLSKQAAFVALQGRTSFELPALTTQVWSLFEALPQALWHVFITPPVNNNALLAQGVVCAESVLVLLCWGWMVWRMPKQVWNEPLYLFVVAYGITAYILIGVTIPNTGALIRYRSEYMLMISAVLVSVSSWPVLNKMDTWMRRFISPSASRT